MLRLACVHSVCIYRGKTTKLAGTGVNLAGMHSLLGGVEVFLSVGWEMRMVGSGRDDSGRGCWEACVGC